MFDKPENARMTKEETEKYGRVINARSAQYENVEIESEEVALFADQIPPPLTEEEIRQRVGEQNFENMKDDKTSSAINN
jgi:hypothetical protein